MTELHEGVTIEGDVVRITNPRAVRLLAHPERQRLIWALYDGEVMTATAAAERFGLTPSAMSYHLRQLEKWGLVKRLDPEDGRERPWSAVARSLSFTPDAVGGASDAARRSYVDIYLQAVTESLRQTADEPSGSNLSRARLELTREEMVALSDEIAGVVERYDRLGPGEGRRAYDLHLGITPRAR